MSYYADTDPNAFRDQSPEAKFRRSLQGTDYQGRTIKQLVFGFLACITALVLWATGQVILLFSGAWLYVLGFIAITVFESKLPGQLKFAGDVAFISLCVGITMMGMPVLAMLMGPVMYGLTFIQHKYLYGSAFHQQSAYLRGITSSQHRRQQLGLPPKEKK
jgi:CHASE2 domain-containing sensor protein